jgi:uncharacterized membrane protein YedE/YeeE
MEIVNFTPASALTGGVVIGAAATLLMWLNGRIAGISGILGGLLPPGSDALWRLAFVVGLVCGGLVYAAAGGDLEAIEIESSHAVLVCAGLLVGYGTRLGSGCTSGHGVCGIGRLAPRGIVSTAIYMAVAAVTVYVTHHVIGG